MAKAMVRCGRSFADLQPCITAFCAVDTGGRKLKTLYPYTDNYAHLATGASVHMPQSTYSGRSVQNG
jgi:hypothetical protein